ncbi:MAG: DUF6448 family protein [Desulforhopalus sp.]|nr:DUF6448 family protein [Desulforhopalus sp.]
MRNRNSIRLHVLGIAALIAVSFIAPKNAAAHCDTLDGPVIEDARKAITARDITPVLKWVREKDEDIVRKAFTRLLDSKGAAAGVAEQDFFATLVKIHRAGEGAPFTGLKPAGSVEPAVAEADRALAGGSPDRLVQLVTGDIAAGIKERYQHAATTYQHKDESVEQGRAFVSAYVAFTHYVERLHQDATGGDAHGDGKHAVASAPGHAGHEQHKPVTGHAHQ